MSYPFSHPASVHTPLCLCPLQFYCKISIFSFMTKPPWSAGELQAATAISQTDITNTVSWQVLYLPTTTPLGLGLNLAWQSRGKGSNTSIFRTTWLTVIGALKNWKRYVIVLQFMFVLLTFSCMQLAGKTLIRTVSFAVLGMSARLRMHENDGHICWYEWGGGNTLYNAGLICLPAVSFLCHSNTKSCLLWSHSNAFSDHFLFTLLYFHVRTTVLSIRAEHYVVNL